MTPAILRSLVVRPTLAWLGAPYDSREAELMLLAIAQQESGCRDRCQMAGGPARGWWQMEPNTAAVVALKWSGGISSMKAMRVTLEDLSNALQWNDHLACAFARGDLWLDRFPLPDVGNQDGAWNTYLRVWRPGVVSPERWPGAYRAAMDAMGNG